MKRSLLQFLGLLISLISYSYFVMWIDYGIFMDKTEYDAFYLNTLQTPFMVVNGIFIALFVSSFFSTFLKTHIKWLFLLFFISSLIMFLVDNHYWNMLNHGQGG